MEQVTQNRNDTAVSASSRLSFSRTTAWNNNDVEKTTSERERSNDNFDQLMNLCFLSLFIETYLAFS